MWYEPKKKPAFRALEYLDQRDLGGTTIQPSANRPAFPRPRGGPNPGSIGTALDRVPPSRAAVICCINLLPRPDAAGFGGGLRTAKEFDAHISQILSK
jgi:hypothetical protein